MPTPATWAVHLDKIRQAMAVNMDAAPAGPAAPFAAQPLQSIVQQPGGESKPAAPAQAQPAQPAPPKSYADRIKATLAQTGMTPEQQHAGKVERYKIGQEQEATRVAAEQAEKEKAKWWKGEVGGVKYDVGHMPTSHARAYVSKLKLEHALGQSKGEQQRKLEQVKLGGRKELATQQAKLGKEEIAFQTDEMVRREEALSKIDPAAAQNNRESREAIAALNASIRAGEIANMEDYRNKSLAIKQEQNDRLDAIAQNVAANKAASAAAARADKRIAQIRTRQTSRDRMINTLTTEIFKSQTDKRNAEAGFFGIGGQDTKQLDKHLANLHKKREVLQQKNQEDAIRIETLGAKYGPVGPAGETISPAGAGVGLGAAEELLAGELMEPSPGAEAAEGPSPPTTAGQKISSVMAKKYLQQADGNRKRAEEKARKDGWKL